MLIHTGPVKILVERQLLRAHQIKLTLQDGPYIFEINPLKLIQSTLFERLSPQEQQRVCLLAGIECAECLPPKG